MAEGLKGKRAWVITEGHAGIEIQAIALAEALGLEPEVMRIKAPFLWGWMPATVWPAPLLFARLKEKKLKPPWPDILTESSGTGCPSVLRCGPAQGLG